ncbi:MAG: biopolymer transporter ExbD, partial [Candidatus Nitrotoga sp.]
MISRRSSLRNAMQPMRDINVVPYIDVMLVLLIIFMITAPLMNVGQIELPTIGKSAAPPVAPLEVIIKRDATLALRDRSNSDREIAVT